LCKKPEERLGFVADALDLMQHPFFRDTNWSDVHNRILTPPFKPNIKSPVDTKMYEKYN